MPPPEPVFEPVDTGSQKKSAAWADCTLARSRIGENTDDRRVTNWLVRVGFIVDFL
jgi:hypothetical protein